MERLDFLSSTLLFPGFIEIRSGYVGIAATIESNMRLLIAATVCLTFYGQLLRFVFLLVFS